MIEIRDNLFSAALNTYQSWFKILMLGSSYIVHIFLVISEIWIWHMEVTFTSHIYIVFMLLRMKDGNENKY